MGEDAPILTILGGPLQNFIVDVRDVADVGDFVAAGAQISLHQVEYGVKYCPRTIALKAGEVVYDGPSCELTPELLNGIYGAESSDLFLPSLDHAGISLRDTQPASSRPGVTPHHPAYPDPRETVPQLAAAG